MPGKVINIFSTVTLLFILSMLFHENLFPQDESGELPFLVNQQSPLLIGAGSIGAAIPMQDAMGFYYNPAQLGYFSRENNFSFFFMPEKADWVDYHYGDPGFISTGLTAGYNFKSTKSRLPLSIGIGYIHNKIIYTGDWDIPQNGTSSIYSFENDDYFNCFSIGACYEYYLLFNFGFAVKPYKSLSEEYNFSSNQIEKYKPGGTAFDFGFMITAPIYDLLLKNKLSNSNENIYKPKLNFTLGYSISNIGGKFDRLERAYKYPLQRTARLGYTIDIGMDVVTTDNSLFNIIDYSFTAEVEDVLWKWKGSTSGVEYQNLLGDIKVGKNLILLKPDYYVSIHKGHIFRLAETAFISLGRNYYLGNYYYVPAVIESFGYGISSEGILKLLEPAFNSTLFSFITNHIKIEYYYAEEKKVLYSKYQGLAIYIKGIEI